MRFAVMNRQQNQGNLTAQQQKIFEMNNHPHGVGAMGGIGAMGSNPPMALSFHKNQALGPVSGGASGVSSTGNRMMLANVVP
jgi:hypothetical protein